MKKLFVFPAMLILASCGHSYTATDTHDAPNPKDKPPKCVVLQWKDEGFFTNTYTSLGTYCRKNDDE